MSEEVQKVNIMKWLQTTVIVVFSVAFIFLTFRYARTGPVTHAIQALGIYGPIIFILAKASTRIVTPVSGAPLYVLSTAIWGPFYGSIFSFIGDMIAAVASFMFARAFGREYVLEKVEEMGSDIMPKVLNMISTTRGLILAHVILIAFPDILNYIAGLSSVSLLTFTLVHLPFALISAFAVSYASGVALSFGDVGIGGFILFVLVMGGLGLLLLKKFGKGYDA